MVLGCLLPSQQFFFSVPIGLVYSIYDSTEVAIQKIIEATQKMIDMATSSNEALKEEGPRYAGINAATKRHLELEIKTLQNAPRDADKLERLIKIKRRQKEEAAYIEDTQRLVAEIEMLKVVRYLVCRNMRK
jgi:response regulator of citrate/malate metabolism